MKKMKILLLIVMVLALSACGISSRPTRHLKYKDSKKYFDAIEYSWQGEVDVYVKKGYYIPELSTTCISVRVTDSVYDAKYYSTITTIDGEETTDDLTIEKQDGDVLLLCYDQLEARNYMIELYREAVDDGREFKLLHVTLDNTDFDPSVQFEYDIAVEEFPGSIGLSGIGLEITTDITNGEELLTGNIIYVIKEPGNVFVAQANVPIEDLLAEDEFVFETVDTLDGNIEYEVHVFYDPIGNEEFLIDLGVYTPND